MRHPLRSSLLVLLVLSLAGAGATASTAEELPAPTPKSVVSYIDTGINPYHEVFRDNSPWAYQHPSTYIPGYPADAQALPITLPPLGEEADWADLVREDCAVWKTVQPRKLYWFPGTRIIGAYSTSPSVDGGCSGLPTGGTEVLDYGGHGTMVSSRGTSSDYGACKSVDCRVVMIQFPGSVNLANPGPSNEPTVAAVKWAADNSGWIDAQSNSWGPIVPLWEPTGAAGLITANPELVREIERANTRHAAFWASGNGVAFRGGVLGHPTMIAAHFGVNGYIVGGHDSGYMNTWPGFSPHIVADSCDAWGAVRNHVSQSGERVAGGTSGATPFAAGSAGLIILEARRLLGDLETGFDGEFGGTVARGPAGLVPSGPLADGLFHRDELRAVLQKTATERPAAQSEDGPVCGAGPYMPTPIKWTDVPAQYPEYIQIGYGATDRVAQALAVRVLKGEVPLPDRSDTDLYLGEVYKVRQVLHTVWDGVP
ncbi:MAG: S8/S53 family peptidase [Actinomycetota bacterium]